MFHSVYRQHELFLAYWVTGRYKDGKVDLGEMGRECDQGALFEIPKQPIKMLCWEKIFLYLNQAENSSKVVRTLHSYRFSVLVRI